MYSYYSCKYATRTHARTHCKLLKLVTNMEYFLFRLKAWGFMWPPVRGKLSRFFVLFLIFLIGTTMLQLNFCRKRMTFFPFREKKKGTVKNMRWCIL